MSKMFNLDPHSLFPSVFCDALIVSLKTNAMETKNLSFNGMELPPYLGYGILDPESTRYENGELYAEYVFECDGSVVHEVRWNTKYCMLFTYCHGARGNISSYPDLRYALLYDCRSWNLHKDDCYLFLSREISKLGNIYVNCPEPDAKKGSADFYPAGKMFILSLPLAGKTEKYLDFLEQITDSEIIRFSHERKGHIIVLNKDSKVTFQPIIIAEFNTPLAHLFNAAKAIVNAGIIDDRIIFRLIINECYDAENSLMKTFIGDNQYQYYCIVFKEFPEDKYESLAGLFHSQIVNLIRTLHLDH
jgi:hypothetical protein